MQSFRNKETDIDADEVGQAKGRHAGAPDKRPGQCVDLFDRQAMHAHRLQCVHDGEEQDAVGDKVGAIVGVDNHLAETTAAKVRDEADHARITLRRGNQLHQAHVAGRIEEVRSEPVLSEIVGPAFSEPSDGEARCVGRDQSAGTAQCIDLGEDLAFGIEVLDNGLDDPVRLGNACKVVCEVAGLDPPERVSGKEGRGARLEKGLVRFRNDAVTRGFGGCAFGGEIEQQTFDAGIREMGGDPRAHRPRAQYGRLTNLEAHSPLLLDR